jgi:hypothetical protein
MAPTAPLYINFFTASGGLGGIFMVPECLMNHGNYLENSFATPSLTLRP